MKKFSKILMSGLAALCLWACSDEANVSQPAMLRMMYMWNSGCN